MTLWQYLSKQVCVQVSLRVNWYHSERMHLKKAPWTLRVESVSDMTVFERVTTVYESGVLLQLIWDNW